MSFYFWDFSVKHCLKICVKMSNLADMRKPNALYIFLIIFLLSSCNIQYTERNDSGFGGGNWNIHPSTAKNVPQNKKDLQIQTTKSNLVIDELLDTVPEAFMSIVSTEKFSAPQANGKLSKINKSNGGSKSESRYMGLKKDLTQLNSQLPSNSKPKWKDIQQILSIKKELKNRISTIPNSNSHWIQWLFFTAAVIFLLVGLKFVLTVDPVSRDIEFALGVVSLLVGIIYYLGFITFPKARKKGIVFKIGYFSTLFLLLTFYSLAVTIPILLIGALFDI